MLKNGQQLKEESLYISLNSTEKLHVKRFFSDRKGQPVLMLHGSIENGKIFYSSSGKGLAPFLAQKGYDVFVPDFRGKGESTPQISRKSKFGHLDMIEEDIPAFYHKIVELKGDVPQHWIAHSWGGVMLLACLAKKHAEMNIGSIVFMGTKRRMSISSWERFYLIEFLWFFIARFFILFYGYLTAVKTNMGADNETKRMHHETRKWIYEKKWTHWSNGFDYSAALKKITLPPILSMTGAGDKVLGHPKDCRLVLDELGDQDYEYRVLGKANGNKQDYDHINILTHPDAASDHFTDIDDWIKKHSGN